MLPICLMKIRTEDWIALKKSSSTILKGHTVVKIGINILGKAGAEEII